MVRTIFTTMAHFSSKFLIRIRNFAKILSFGSEKFMKTIFLFRFSKLMEIPRRRACGLCNRSSELPKREGSVSLNIDGIRNLNFERKIKIPFRKNEIFMAPSRFLEREAKSLHNVGLDSIIGSLSAENEFKTFPILCFPSFS